MGLADSLESALGKRSGPMPGSGSVDPNERVSWAGGDKIEPAGPSSDAAELERELARKDLTPSARRVLEAERGKVAGGSSPLADSLSAAFNAPTPARSPKPATGPARETSGLDNNPIGEVGLHLVSGVGSSILGGWRGLATIASGGSLDDAAHAVMDTTERGTYQPETASGKAVTGALASDYNPLNWWSNAATWAGGKTADVATRLGASPETAGAAGATVNTGMNAALMALPFVNRFRGGAAANESLPAAERAAIPAQAGGESMPLQTVPKAAEPVVKPRLKGPPAIAVEVEAPKFVEAVKTAGEGKSLAPAEQTRRADVLRRIGMSDARISALEGNAKEGGTDFQTSKLKNQGGDFLRGKLDEERAALESHAERLVRDTGGTLGTDSVALESRGHAILSPLEGFKQWFTDQTSSLYKQARERAGGQPVDLGTFRQILGTDSKFANTDTIELRKGVQARMKELGLIDEKGNIKPATVEQAENLRQYVNEEWTPKANGRIRELKNALDVDVTSAAGEDIFKKARALHAMKESIFSDPKGLSSILDSEGINRKVPIEKIADTITALPNAQFEHIVKTLQQVPPELRPQAQAALSEIKAQFINRMTDQAKSRVGQWGARDVSAYLNKNSAKIAKVFSKDEIAKIQDLNEAGHILRLDQSYPGAAVQEHNLIQRGAMAGLRTGPAAAGAAIGGPPMAAVGGFLGNIAANKFGEASSLRSAQKRVVRLSDFPK